MINAVSLLCLPVNIWLAANNPALREVLAKNPVTLPIQYAIAVVGMLLCLMAGVFILKGANWARLLYTIWGGIGLVYTFLTAPAKLLLVPSIIFYGIMVFFLFRPNANAYFTNPANAEYS
jgi:hypothetical protein